MGRKINFKCYDCGCLDEKLWQSRPKPECWRAKVCARLRNYYKGHEANKEKALERHRYLKYRSGKCGLCSSTDRLEVHHIQPQSKGGMDARFNTLTLCHQCHKIISKYYEAIGWT